MDWSETIVLTVDGVENEVRLIEGADIRLMYVEPMGDFRLEESQKV